MPLAQTGYIKEDVMSDGLSLEKLKIDERLRKVEEQTVRLISHMESEFGSANTEGNLTGALNRIEGSLKALNERVAIQNGKVRKLEDWKTYCLGGAGMLGGLITFVFFIVDKIKK